MVVFTCNHCGDTLQKPKVAKHYQFRCHRAPFLTCVDCLKDFRDEEYVAHTKCITEEERYGGKNYVPKPSANKGERKQQKWIYIVNNLLNSKIDLSHAERSFLNTLSKFDNIPRKKTKFLNFVKNAVGNRINTVTVENVWDKMEAAYKQNQQITTQPQESNNYETEKTDQSTDLNKSLNDHQENIVDNQNNENICKEHNSAQHQKEINQTCDTNGNMDEKQTINGKKSKKRRLAESVETREEQPVMKIKKAPILLEMNVCENDDRKAAFDWRLTILGIVQNKSEISLKKLQKKVVSLYTSSSAKSMEYEKIITKFHKKLKKIPEIIVSENIVKLA